MASKSYFIELIVNFNDDTMQGKEELLRVAAARMAKSLMSVAMLISDRKPPMISMIERDSFEGEQEIDLAAYDTSGPCPTCGHDEHEVADSFGYVDWEGSDAS